MREVKLARSRRRTMWKRISGGECEQKRAHVEGGMAAGCVEELR